MAVDYDLGEQVAVVTGAGAGLGLAFATALSEAGAIVILAEVDSGKGYPAEQGLQQRGLKAHYLPLDVCQYEQVHQVAHQVVESWGRLDIWINNAGVALHGPSESLSLDRWQKSIDIMLSGTFFGCQAAGQVMIPQGYGTIINIASVNGLVAQAGRAAYCAAKAGVIRLTEVLSAEWAAYGVRVNAIAPSVVLTDLARSTIGSGLASLEEYTERTPARRLGEIDELVYTLLYLASNQASYVTGQTLLVDGGWVSDHYL